MNLNIINKYCFEWTKEDWRDAYAEYCEHNMFGVKTKQQYYDFVNERHKKLQELEKPLSPELIEIWHNGKIAARNWAKSRNCDINGADRNMTAVKEITDERVSDIENTLIDIQQQIEYNNERTDLAGK